MKRPALPKGLQRDIRIGRMLRATAGPAKQQQNGLLTGWAEAKAPDGKTYFYHAESGEVSWERPAAAAADKDGGKPKVPSSAVVVAAKPVIPGIPVANGVAKLPRGWRCLTGADGKPYYFNKKTGETSWTPPPPPAADGEDEEPKEIGEKLEVAANMMKEGWRRAKQVAAVKVFKATTTDEPEVDRMYEQIMQIDSQMNGIKQAVEAYLKSLVEMCWSAEQLATKFGDYVCEPRAIGHAPATQAASAWRELQKGATRSLEVQCTSKVLQPIASYLGETQGIKRLYEERQKRLVDYDYYKRKVAEMVQRPPKDGTKMTRNAEKLATSEAAYLNVKNELVARMQAMLEERWDFANAPLLQLLDFQTSFYGNLNTAVTPFAAHTYEGALLDAEARTTARRTLQTAALTEAVMPKPATHYVSMPSQPQQQYAGAPPPPHSPMGAGAASGARPPPPPGPPPRPQLPPGASRMRALTNYEATDARMLSFSAGEMMVKEREEAGWYYGSNSRGDQGYFPASYVEAV